MSQLIGVPDWASNTFHTPLDYRSIMGTRKIQLTHSFVVTTSLGVINVPRGFVSDGASVPQAFWSIFPPFGKYLEAAVVHDYIYVSLCHIYSKKEADTIFKELCIALRVSKTKASIMYRVVSIFGKGNW